ncbi:WYL domain-containing protein [Lacticaseibacillus pabuli]|uniref:WYL domain-containing protein n=1 Tax=Lacticaseibacillus pabuli TaxID=3025672 RepID=A0ABY7WRL5_9LACO|nr:WYL domain-containing protein [Lacticaseibacillus sp. KACC 23028]WDF82361.1 WYL domain-containing protein [Lacticaseibacillus sp. KACC 23028]
MDNKSSRRALATYMALLNGETITLAKWAEIKAQFEPETVNSDSESVKRSFQRDLTVIRDTMRDADDSRDLVLRDGCYRLVGTADEGQIGTLIAIGHILLASRAFADQDMQRVIQQLGAPLGPEAHVQFQHALATAISKYQGITNGRVVLTNLNLIVSAITRQQALNFQYRVSSGERVSYTAVPLVTAFQDGFFQVAMFDCKTQARRLFRVDRLLMLEVSQTTPDGKVSAAVRRLMRDDYCNQKDCEKTVTVQLETAQPIDTVQNQFPRTRCLNKSATGVHLFEVTDSEAAIHKWVTGQGSRVRVLSP